MLSKTSSHNSDGKSKVQPQQQQLMSGKTTTASSFSLKSNGSTGSATCDSSASSHSLEVPSMPSFDSSTIILAPHHLHLLHQPQQQAPSSSPASSTTAIRHQRHVSSPSVLSSAHVKPTTTTPTSVAAAAAAVLTHSHVMLPKGPSSPLIVNNNNNNSVPASKERRSSSHSRVHHRDHHSHHVRSNSNPKQQPATTGPKVVVAIHDYEPVNRSTDLALVKGQEYEVLSERIDGCVGWWRVRSGSGDMGLIPSNYVKDKRLIPTTGTSSSSSSGVSSSLNSSHHQRTNSGKKSASSSSEALKSLSLSNGSNSSSGCSSSSSSPAAHILSHKSKESLAQCHWFLPELDRESAERLLKADGREGCFLVRFSASQELYTISVLVRKHSHSDDIKHYLIRRSENGSNRNNNNNSNTSGMSFYLSENQRFPSIEELIHYHRQEAGSLAIRLKHLPTLIHPDSRDTNKSNGGHMSRLSLSKLYGDKSWEIRVAELSLLEELGSGQFGVVRKGRWTRAVVVNESTGQKKTVVSEVAVKLMKEGTMSESDFVREAKVMTKLRHPNLVQLYGLCIEHRPICIVTEFMKHGSLLSFLRGKASGLKSNSAALTSMCLQVCQGMAYLEANNYIHRDLAARNCLVGPAVDPNHPHQPLVKVADFGLARLVADSNSEYTSSSGTKFPIKWAPPEVLYFTKFSSKSDVWAFGVLMWEVFSCGQMPYGRSSNAQVVELIRAGERLQRPSRSCSSESFGLMQVCWNESPDQRPSFAQLQLKLQQLLLSC